jgi:hypothetical protein
LAEVGVEGNLLTVLPSLFLFQLLLTFQVEHLIQL